VDNGSDLSIHPAIGQPPSLPHFTTFAGHSLRFIHPMKNKIHSVLLALVLATGAMAATAAATLIHIDVISADQIVVEGKPASVATLPAVVSSLVKDKEHTAVEIKVSEKMDKAKVEEIKNACRKAGISLFSLTAKP
jgi:biopolymer transport protein ExbD